MKAKTIHTINARSNVMLEVMRDCFGLSPLHMHREIQAMRNQLEEILAAKGIRYDNLKSALTPNQDRREIALVFDSIAVGSNSSGHAVFERLLPLLHKDSRLCILVGDYGGDSRHEDLMQAALREVVRPNRVIPRRHGSQFYIVYLNNLTSAMVAEIDAGLADWTAYLGLADTTFASRFKLVLSTLLMNVCVKAGKTIIQGHEDDRPNSDNVNMSGLPFEKSGYVCRSVPSNLYGVLLNYKIERPVFEGFEIDTEFSLNAISEQPLPLDGFSVLVKEARLAYLKREKSPSIMRAGLEDISTDELAALIKEKVRASYVYSMSPDPTDSIVKFNVIIEVGGGSTEPTRLLAALKYDATEKALELLTLF